MNLLEGLWVGLVSGLMASALVFLMAQRTRPRIEIAPQIAKDSADIYRMKLVNQARRAALDVRLDLQLRTTSSQPGGAYQPHSHPRVFKEPFHFDLPGFRKKDASARYARVYELNQNLESLWTDDTNQYLELQVFAVDSFSGFGRVFSREFRDKRSCIKIGMFEHGKSVEIRG